MDSTKYKEEISQEFLKSKFLKNLKSAKKRVKKKKVFEPAKGAIESSFIRKHPIPIHVQKEMCE